MLPGMSSTVVGFSVSGVVPNALNWGNIIGVDGGSTAALTISGIGETIQLRAEISSVSVSGGAGGLFYANGSSPPVVDSVGIGDGQTLDFNVNNGSSVSFSVGATADPPWSINATVTIKYKSAGSGTFDQTLDTFTISLGA